MTHSLHQSHRSGYHSTARNRVLLRVYQKSWYYQEISKKTFSQLAKSTSRLKDRLRSNACHVNDISLYPSAQCVQHIRSRFFVMNKEVSMIFRSLLSPVPSIHDPLFAGSWPDIFGGSVIRLQISSSHVGHTRLYDYASKFLATLRFSADA